MRVRTGIYVRVSTDEQRDNGFSIDNQLRLLEEYCQKNNYDIVDVYNDAGYSGKNLLRPNMQRLIKDINDRKIDKLIAIKVDRLTRNGYDGYWLLNYCEENDVKIELILEPYDVSTANGEMIFGINLIFGQRERKEIGARTKRGLEEMALQKKHPNKAPFGYVKNEETGNLEINPVESIIVKEIFELGASGKSIRGIAHLLQDRYFPKCKRLESKIHNILRNTIYIGINHFGKTHRKKEDVIVVENYCEPIITEKLFKEANRMLEKNKHANYGTHVHLFSSLVRCPDCNKILSSTMSYKYNRDKSKKRKYYFLVCKNDNCISKGTYYNTQKLEKKLIKMLNQLTIYMLEYEYSIAVPQNDKSDEIAKLEKAINHLETQEKKLVDLYVNSSLNVEAINQKNESIKKELDVLRNKYKEIIKENVVAFDYDLFEKFDQEKVFPYQFAHAWEKLEKAEQKEILRKYIISIDVERNDNYEVEIKNIKFNSDFFKSEDKDLIKTLELSVDERYKGFEYSDLVITEQNFGKIIGTKRAFSFDQFNILDSETKKRLYEESKQFYGIDKEGIKAHKFVVKGQHISDLIVFPC